MNVASCDKFDSLERSRSIALRSSMVDCSGAVLRLWQEETCSGRRMSCSRSRRLGRDCTPGTSPV